MSGEGSARHQDELTLKQQRRIEREICESRPLVDEPEPATRLAAEYDNDPVYAAKAADLAVHYSALRKTRPDGNCFFRAFAYAYLERLVEEPDRFRAFERLVADSKDRLVRLGFAQFTVEDFYEIFMEVVHRIGEEIKKSVPDAHRELHKIFNEQGYSDYIVVYLRLVTSGQLQTDGDFYQNFIDGDRTVSEFCHQVRSRSRSRPRPRRSRSLYQ